MFNKGLLFFISVCMFGAALLLLIAAMVIHAVLGDESWFPIPFAIASAVVAVVGLIFACVKRSGDKNEE